MLASGVRRSCDTESMSAVLRTSLWRATSSSVASWREPVAPQRQRDLVGGQREDPGRLRVRSARRRPRVSAHSDADSGLRPTRTRIDVARRRGPGASAARPPGRPARDRGSRTQRAGSSPGVRTSDGDDAAAAGAGAACRVREDPLGRWRRRRGIQTRSSRRVAGSRSTISPAGVSVDGAVARIG